MKLSKKLLSTALAVLMTGCMTASAFADTNSQSSSFKFTPGEINIGEVPMRSYSEMDEKSHASIDPHRHTAVTYPEKYSSVEEGYITSVKNQGNYGTCWAHATAAATEASIIKNLGYSSSVDISELHLAYFHYNKAYDPLSMLSGDSSNIGAMYRYYGFLDLGGSPFTTPFTLARWTGSVDESEYTKYSYDNATPSFSVENKAEAFSLSDIHLEDMYWVSPQDIDDMKHMIMTYGAGTFSYYHDDSFYNEATAAFCTLNVSSTNHQVTVVGWDDNFSKENFNRNNRPQNDGAWLIKNSWDTTWGDDGYFWVSYEDTSAQSSWSQFYSFGTADNFDKNYQYDGTINFNSEDVTGGATVANVFTAESEEELKAFSFWTAQNDVDYSAQIYTNLTDASNPTSGTAMLTEALEGNEAHSGYHTIELDEVISLEEGTTFAIVITLSANLEDQTCLMIDQSDNWSWVVFTNKANAGESFLQSANSTDWVDKSKQGINYRIKAFTDVVGGMDDTDIVITDSDDDTSSDDDSMDDWWSSWGWDTENGSNAKGPHGAVAGIKLGDANGDSSVTMEDVVLMQKAIAKLTTITSENQTTASDIDGDGSLTMTDVTFLQKHIAGLL